MLLRAQHPTLVHALNVIVSPSAIIRAVSAIIVDAINRMALARRRTHILQKLLEAGPLWADRDTRPAVTVEVDSIGARAANDHCAPTAVGPRRAPTSASIALPVRRMRLGRPLRVIAPAGPRMAGFQMARGHDHRSPAVTPAIPVAVPAAREGIALGDEKSEPLTSQISALCHLEIIAFVAFGWLQERVSFTRGSLDA